MFIICLGLLNNFKKKVLFIYFNTNKFKKWDAKYKAIIKNVPMLKNVHH